MAIHLKRAIARVVRSEQRIVFLLIDGTCVCFGGEICHFADCRVCPMSRDDWLSLTLLENCNPIH